MKLGMPVRLNLLDIVKKAISFGSIAFLSYLVLFCNMQEAKAGTLIDTILAQNHKLAMSESKRVSGWGNKSYSGSHPEDFARHKSTPYFDVNDSPRFEQYDPPFILDDGYSKGKTVGYMFGRAMRWTICHTVKLGCSR